MENTHPFEQEGRLFALNGVLQGLEQIEAELSADTALLQGQTDSERLFALITHEIRGNGGAVPAGIIAAVGWIVANVPLYSLNLVLTTPTELFALRYSDTNTPYLLERPAGGGDGSGALHHRSSLGTSVRSEEAAERKAPSRPRRGGPPSCASYVPAALKA